MEYIPLFISLPAYCARGIPEDLIEQALESRGLNKATIKAIRRSARSGHQPWVVVFDGYDEIHSEENLFKKCKLNEKWGLKRNKYIISCRTSYLDGLAKNGKTKQVLFTAGKSTHKELTIAPFSTDQVEAYIKDFAASEYNRYKDKGWDENRYDQALKKIPGLKAWMTTPFLLIVGLQALPKLDKKQKAGKFTKNDIYNAFIEEWLDREVNKPKNSVDKVQLKHFCQDLGYTLWLKGKSVIEKKDATMQAFFQRSVELQSAPVRHMGQGKYQFIHPDFKLFFAVQKIIRSLLQKEYNNHPICTITLDKGIAPFIAEALNQDMICPLVLMTGSNNTPIVQANARILLKQVPKNSLDKLPLIVQHFVKDIVRQAQAAYTKIDEETRNDMNLLLTWHKEDKENDKKKNNEGEEWGKFYRKIKEKVAEIPQNLKKLESLSPILQSLKTLLSTNQASVLGVDEIFNQIWAMLQIVRAQKSDEGDNALHLACHWSGSLEIVRWLLEECEFGLETKGRDGKTPFLCAAGNGHLAIAKLLKERGANIHAQDKNRDNALHYACAFSGSEEMVTWLLDVCKLGLDIEIKGKYKRTPFLFAAKNGQLKIAKLLKERGANIQEEDEHGNDALHQACYFSGSLEIVRWLLEECEFGIETKGNRQATPFICAAENGQLEIAKLLKERGANIHAKTEGGDNALHKACYKGSEEMVNWLLDECNLGLETKNQYERTPFLFATEGQLAIAKLLKNRGANINAKSESGNNALHAAFYSGSVDIVNWLLDECKIGADIHTQDNEGNNALHAACASGSEEMVTWLLEECEFGIETKGNRQATPFICAAEKGQLEIAKRLKERGANIQEEDEHGENALHAACAFSGSVEMVDWLLDECNLGLETKNQYERTPFIYAAENGQISIAKRLKNRGANINAKSESGNNALHLACYYSGSVEMVTWLLNVCKLDIETKGRYQRTPFFYAALKGQVEIAKLLKERGANIHAKSESGNNALHAACASGSVEMVTWLLDVCKIGIETKGFNQKTPFLCAAKNGQLEIAKLLRERGANINAKSKYGKNALHIACLFSGSVDMVTWLLDVCKLGIEKKNQYKRTPFLCAAEKGQVEIAKLLKERGANIKEEDKYGDNALHTACLFSGSVDMVTWLLDVCKLGIEKKNQYKRTPFLCAAEKGQVEIAKLLKERGANIKEEDKYGDNALHTACLFSGSVDMVTWLLDVCKLGIEKKNQYKRTPFLCAAEKGQLKIAKLLKERGANIHAKNGNGHNALWYAKNTYNKNQEMISYLEKELGLKSKSWW